ncbi:MAG TPA: aromatic ring-hydroxylating dioxygenase subunit alpha [Acidimicrobiia bacterium]|nr:aromatic ring-hydroxylating dioxygenase subunit alpha [Acidimicrobiia bacterium]
MSSNGAVAPAPVDPELLRRVLDPTGSGRMLPREAYTDDAVLAWEREQFFARTWLCAGRVSDLREPGERRGARVAGEGVLLVRDARRQLRAFANTCRHRGHELLPCGATAKRNAIHCPYHAWTYSLEGTLQATPRFDPPPGFDPSENGLVPLRVEEWNGWAMVNLSGDAPPLSEHVGALDDLLANYQCADLVSGAMHEYEMAANWKLPIENYHECYHCPAIHPELCVVSPPTSGDNYTLPGMFVGGTMDLEPFATTMSMDGHSAAAILPGLDARQRREIVYIGLFPNLLISAHPDYVMTHRIDPISPSTSFVECEWLFAAESVQDDAFDPAYAVDFWDVTNRQDWSACEGVQRGLTSRGYRPGPFAAQEDAVQQWVTLVARSYVAGALQPI